MAPLFLFHPQFFNHPFILTSSNFPQLKYPFPSHTLSLSLSLSHALSHSLTFQESIYLIFWCCKENVADSQPQNVDPRKLFTEIFFTLCHIHTLLITCLPRDWERDIDREERGRETGDRDRDRGER
jgi:hypothetical protein